MEKTFHDLLKHSGIYGAGLILSRLASIVLLPVYTRYLSPADYGVLSIVDLLVALLGIVLASGTVRALGRYHFDVETEVERDQLWWTGLLLLAAAATVGLTPAILLRERLAVLSLGASQTAGAYYLAIALPTLGLTSLEQLLQTHLRVNKKSVLFVALSLSRLLLNITLNLYFLIGLGLGITAILWGNLLASLVSALALFGFFIKLRGSFSFNFDLVGRLFSYGAPLVVTALLAVALHQLDRYLLRVFLDLEKVGIYTVAYAIGQGINTLILLPFSQIWYVAIYEIAPREDAKRVYADVFGYFMSVLLSVLLAVALFCRPLLRFLVAPDFYDAAELIPIICLAYAFFSMHAHFNVPALLAKKTTSLIPAHAGALAVNLAGNLVLIPRLGVVGAAWASVITFLAFSFLGLMIYRRIDRFPYPLALLGIRMVVLIGAYAAWAGLTSWPERPWTTGASAALLWVAASTALLGPAVLRWLSEHRGPDRASRQHADLDLGA